MPAVLTHDFFGRDAFDMVAAELGLTTSDERDAFLLGNQGPDPLFYLVAAPWVGSQNRMGGRMHHEQTPKLLASLREAVETVPTSERGVAVAYAAGFLCHYLLDSTMHPLVFGQQYALCDAGVDGLTRADGSRVHQEIEKDFDEMVLFTKTGETIATYKPYRKVLRASDKVLATIDKLYFYANLWTYDQSVDLDVFTQATKAFRLMQRVFYAPGAAKRRVWVGIEGLVGKGGYSQYDAMAHSVRRETVSAFDNHEHLDWENPFTGAHTTESFWDLYEEAQARVFDAERLFFSEGFDQERARELSGDLNFDGQPLDADGLTDDEA